MKQCTSDMKDVGFENLCRLIQTFSHASTDENLGSDIDLLEIISSDMNKLDNLFLEESSDIFDETGLFADFANGDDSSM